MSLWGDFSIPVIGGSGEHASGKTLFGYLMVIDDEGNVGNDQIKIWDFELSSVDYRHQFGVPDSDYVSVPEQMVELYGSEFTELQLAEWFMKEINDLEANKYRAVMIDPASDIESAIATWVRANPDKFGYTAGQFGGKSDGLFWGAMKSHWKRLLTILAAKVETVYFTTHMRQKFSGNTPTRKREAKGKSTLTELASLYLEFDRSLDAQGKTPTAPRAIVRKTRLVKFVDGELKPILPPGINPATPARIREYIEAPPNYAKLRKDEKPVIKEATAEELAEMELEAAVARRDAAEYERDKEGIRQNAMRQQAEMAARRSVQVPPQVEPKKLDTAAEKATAEQVESIQMMVKLLIDDGKLTMEAWKQAIGKRGVEKANQLSIDQANVIIENLTKKIDVFDHLKAAFKELAKNSTGS